MKGKAVCFVVFTTALSFSGASNAGRYWPEEVLTEWELFLNNGVAYISSPQFVSHCLYSRGQINMTGTEFDRAQYAYAMSAKARGKKLRYVVDNTQTSCVISGLREVD